MKKVVKFGGSSLADANQFKKVGDIIRADENRVFVVEAGVDDVRQIHIKTVVGTGIRVVWRQPFVGSEFVDIVSIDDDAVARQWRGDVHPSAHGVKLLVLKRVGVDGEVYVDLRRVRIFGFAVT